MKKEKSCGAVIYKYYNDKLFFLIVKHNQGHYSFPKGHMEKNETEKETAIREVKEETNIDINIIEGFFEKVTYIPKKNTIKDVFFFLAIPLSDKIKIQEDEISFAKWYEEKDAFDILTYANDKNILKNACFFINNNL